MSNIQRSVNTMIKTGGPRPPVVSTAAASMTPKEIIAIVRRHVLLIISCTIIGTVLGVASWYALQKYNPKYTAQTIIEVDSPGESDPTIIGGIPPNKDLYYQFRSSKAGLIKQQRSLEKLLLDDQVRSTKWFAQFNSTAKAVEDLKDNLGVSPHRDRNWITVSMTCGSIKESALIVNEMTGLFIQSQRARATRDVAEQLGKRNDQKSDLEVALQVHENTLETLRKGTDFANLGKATFRSYLDERLAIVQAKRDQLVTDIQGLETNIVTLERRASQEFDDVVRERVERDPTASTMRQRIAIFEVSLSQLLTRFGEKHKQVKQTLQALKQANSDLLARQNEIGNLQRQAAVIIAKDEKIAFMVQLEAMNNQVNAAKAEYRELRDVKAAYEKGVIKRDEKQEALQSMNEYIEKLTSIHDDPKVSKLRQLWDAPEPLEMSFPKLIIFLPGGLFLGLMMGFALAFAIELLNDLLRTPSDAIKLRAPLLGMICHTIEDEGINQTNVYHAVRQVPYSIMAECYRQLRTNLMLSGTQGASYKSILVTSCAIGCGKTSVANNLASTFIAEGKKVLLIDTNFRSPTSTIIFPQVDADVSIGRHGDFGLSNYLLGQCEYEEVARPTGVENLDVIDSGPLPANPAEILANENMAKLLEKATQEYDKVVIDGPPLLVSDAKVLASQAEGTILVFNTAATHKGEAQRALRELSEIKANVIGTVLLGVKALKGGYFQEMYRSYEKFQQAQLTTAGVS